MTFPNLPSTPVAGKILWQRDAHRIVLPKGHARRRSIRLAVERNSIDALGEPSWQLVQEIQLDSVGALRRDLVGDALRTPVEPYTLDVILGALLDLIGRQLPSDS